MLLFASKNFNEVVNGYTNFKDHRNLASTVIDTNKLNHLFMKYFEKQIIRLFGQLTFNTCYIQNVVWNHRNVSFVFQMC